MSLWRVTGPSGPCVPAVLAKPDPTLVLEKLFYAVSFL